MIYKPKTLPAGIRTGACPWGPGRNAVAHHACDRRNGDHLQQRWREPFFPTRLEKNRKLWKRWRKTI